MANCMHGGVPAAISLLRFLIVCVSLASYVAFVLSLFVPHLAFFWCIGKAVLCDYGGSWVSSHEVLLTQS